MMRLLHIFFSVIIILVSGESWALLREKAELKQGRYTGSISLPNEKLAVVADIFLESPEDLTQFPSLNAIFKVTLGGYNSHEYRTEIYKDLKYDFDEGALTFDEMNNDLVMTTEVNKVSGSTKITGKVYFRSSSAWGELELTQESDEPEDFLDQSPKILNTKPFVPALDGQYLGICNGLPTALQVQTARGLGDRKIDPNISTGLEKDYGITGRLGYKNDSFCGGLPKSKWCTREHFTAGSYNFILGKLSLRGERSSIKCSRKNQTTLSCQYQAFSKLINCDLKKEVKIPDSAKLFPRSFNLTATPEQRKDLPEPNPPRNEKLTEALGGNFYGFVHNESNDTYLPIRIEVIPFSSTENPHNPNQMMVSATASIYLQSFESGQFYTQRYEPRSFYLRPGFVLAGSGTDSFFTVTEWKQGFIRGEFYSHAFGKVGTIQLIKGSPLKTPVGMKVVNSFHGEFDRFFPEGKYRQWLKLDFPAQPNDIKENLVRFSGSYQSIVGQTPIRDIEVGFFDPFTGKFGWQLSLEEDSTFGAGQVREDKNIDVFWPPRPIFGVVGDDYEFLTYSRKK